MLRLDRVYFHTLKVVALALALAIAVTMNIRTMQQSMIVKEAVSVAAVAFVVVRVAHHEKMSYYVHPLVHAEQLRYGVSR